jgi:hypothetical protein
MNRAAYAILLTPLLFLCSSTLSPAAPAEPFDYEPPKLLVGNLYSLEPGPRKLLFKSVRRATRTGATVQASCDYTYPDGSLAARDQIVYESGQLVSFEEEELQTGEKGTATIRPDPKQPGRKRIYFEYTVGKGGDTKKSTASEAMENDTLIDDMIGPFITTHWATFEKGSPARFRYIVLSRKETVGFKLIKTADATWQGKPVVHIKMEPTSFIIAKLVDPLLFIVEKNGEHRILEYVGRTTPLIKSGSKWKDLDARSVYEWN